MLTWPDYAVLAGSLIVLLAIGVSFTRQQRDTVDFFLARRQVPWWAACLSFLATEVSAVTIISVPATAYSENWEYAQFFVGSSLAKLAVAFLFIPAFYRHNVTTIYELAGSGVRLTVTAVAVAHLLSWSLLPTIAIFVVISIVYIATGGVKAIVWTNVFQAVMFLGAGAVTLGFLVTQIDGGLGAIVQVAGAAGRLNLVNWGPAPGASDFWRRILSDPNIVWVALLNGFIGSMAAFGTDHDLMQRLLTVETRRESQRTLALTPIGTLLTLVIYLGLGAGLYTFYAQHPAPALARTDEILPHFVREAMPTVLRGFMLSAIVLASIDSPLGSLSASFVTDIYRPLLARGRSERHYLGVSRLAVLAFGIVLGLLAGAFSLVTGQMLWVVFKVAGVTFGSLLGVFLLGLLTTRRVKDGANVAAMIVMALVNLALLVLSEMKVLAFGWSWLVVLGTVGTILLALTFSATARRDSSRPS